MADSKLSEPDAGLIIACDDFVAALREADESRDEELPEAEINGLLEPIIAMRAKALAGHQARARAVAAFFSELRRGDGGDWRLMLALLRDLTPRPERRLQAGVQVRRATGAGQAGNGRRRAP